MKKLTAVYVFLALGLFITSCDKYLDLEPEDTIVEDKVFEKFSTAESAVAGTYHMLFEAATSDYVMPEGSSPTCDYGVAVGRNFYDAFNNGTILTDDGNVQNIYESYYAAINQANLLIAKIQELGKYDSESMQKHMAEAKFIRAYAFHRLLVWFGDGALMNKLNGPGVVLYLQHYNGFDRDKDIRPRNTIEEVYQQIITDLEDAIVDLPESNQISEMESRVSRANKTICEALLARTYLYKQDFVKAAEYAELVLAKSEYKLEEDLLNVFPPNPNDAAIPFSTEHIFGFPVSSNGGNWQFGGNRIYYIFNNFWYSNAFEASISHTDERRIKLMREATNSGNTIYVTNKYPNSNGRDNMTMMRLSEMMLTRAEALAVSSNQVSSEAVNLLNEVYLRANPTELGYTTDDFMTVQDLVETILAERDKELCFEGLQRFDQLRTGRPLYNADLAENKKVLPIPLREVEITNGILKQNEGYLTN